MWFSAIESLYVDVGHRAIVFCRFLKPPHAGEVLPKFLIDNIIFSFFFAEKSPSERSRSTPVVFLALRVCLHRVALPLHRLTMAPLA
jgi:hypothetical protein